MIAPLYTPDTTGLILWAVLTAIALVSLFTAASRPPRQRDYILPDRKVDA